MHNGSIIIDDIEDGSDTRRGEPAIHLAHGLPTAINAGNLLYFLPLLTIARQPDLTSRQRDEIYQVMVNTFVQGHMGQSQDLFWSKPRPNGHGGFWNEEQLEDRILQMHAYKTAAPLRAVAEVACIVGETSSSVREICARFSESWGVAFQILDDVHNFSCSQNWGKVRGEDIAAGKASYVVYKAVTMLSGADRESLVSLLGDPERRASPSGLETGIKLIEQSGALTAAREFASELVESDWPSFSDALPQTQSKIMLRMFLSDLLNLSFELESN